MPFRDAYRRIGALVNATRTAGRRLATLDAADLEREGLPATLVEHLDPVRAARRRSG
jgi:argininosuccinate lyase